MVTAETGLYRVGTVAELREKGCIVVSTGRHGVAVFWHEGRPYAVDNRCPHMGFPLARGSCRDGILTCHWHHARFDLASGGTLDPWADDVVAYPSFIRDGIVWLGPPTDTANRRQHYFDRLGEGLEQDLDLVIVKSVIGLRDLGVSSRDILRVGVEFGSRYRRAGWGPGLTILTAMANVVPVLSDEQPVLGLYHGLVHVARDCDAVPPRFDLRPLSGADLSAERLKAWFRRAVEVRDTDGAVRILQTAIATTQSRDVADMLGAAATDHYFLSGGHTLDFINKAFESLELTGWESAPTVLPSVVGGLCQSQRAEEQNAWRNPIDLVELATPVIVRLPDLIQTTSPEDDRSSKLDDADFDRLVDLLVGDDPRATLDALASTLERGHSIVDLGQALACAAALRIARFHTSNEFGDWITVLHTFTYCNALHQALRRSPSPELARGIVHGALRLYLDRFLNMPAAQLPSDRDVGGLPDEADALREQLLDAMDQQQRVADAARLVYHYQARGHVITPLLATLGQGLLREDAEFHSYQMFEAAVRQHGHLRADRPAHARVVLVAAARYLAAHAPTARAMLQTARIGLRLHRGDDLTQDE